MQLSSDALALVGNFSDSRAINDALLRAGDHFHLISPATSCSRLPSGCEVVFAAVPIYPNETYAVDGGKVALGRAALMRLSSAAGVTWDTEKSGRQRDDDEPVHPYYVHWRAIGKWRDLSNAWLPLVGDGLIDLRDGSAQALKVLQSARPKYKDKEMTLSAEQAGQVQLRDKRAKALELAQSGAKLRAIRDIPGLTRAYEADELAGKPFLVARLQYVGTGGAEDNRAIRESFLGARSSLFGPTAPTRLPADITTDGEVVEEEPLVCEYCGGSDDVREVRDHQGHPIHACKGEKCQELCHRNARGPQPEKKTAPAAKPTPAKEGPVSVATVRFGRDQGRSISAITDKDLHWYADQIRRSINDPGKAKYQLANEKHLVDITEEMARRANRAPAAASQIDPGDVFGDDEIPW